MRKRLLIVDDEKNIGEAFVQLFKDDFEVAVCLSGGDAFQKLDEYRPDLIFLDINMPKMNGLEVLKDIVKRTQQIPVVMMTAYGTVETAVEAMKLGAVDYVQKPFNNDELRILVGRTLKAKGLEKEIQYYRDATNAEFSFDQIIGISASITDIKETARKVAASDSTVFILGESGTGKELLARAIHYGSHRRHGPFVPVNCAAIPDEIIESELFGHKKGAFTGAIADRPGKFQMAHEGTIFLDEVGDMSLRVQAKILRALEERTVIPVGDTKPAVLDVRVISATNKDARRLVEIGEFREDLYYRLNVVPMRLPALRERKEDIALLVDFFIQKFTHQDTQVKASPELIERLSAQEWPGNIRELRNLVERMLIFRQGNVLEMDTLPEGMTHSPLDSAHVDWLRSCARRVICSDVTLHSLLGDLTGQIEKEAIHLALKQCEANISQVAELMGLSRQSIHDKLKKYRIRLDDYRQEANRRDLPAD